MSGPKVSTYELAQQRKAEQERKERERQRQEAEKLRKRMEAERKLEEEVNRRCSALNKKGRELDSLLSSADRMMEREKQREQEREKELANKKKEAAEVRERVVRAEDITRTADFDDLLEEARRQTEDSEETKADMEAFINELLQEKQERHSLVAAYLTGNQIEEIEKEEIKSTEEQEFEKLLFTMEEEYEEIVNDRAFFRFHKESMIRLEGICKRQQEYRSYRILREVYYGEFGKMKKAREKWHKKLDTWREPFDEAYIQYRAICNLLGRKPEHFYLNPETVEEDVRLLNQKTKALQEENLRIQESGEVTRILSEVMEEMGYQVLGTKDVAKKSGDKVHNTVFSYGEGSGIHVVDNGERITMEIVGLDDADRDISQEEKEYLEEEQVHFCDSFHEIEKELEKRGVVLKQRVRMMPPSQEYASIMKMDDYTMTEHKSKAKSLSKVDKKAKRKQQGKRYMSE